MNYEKIIIELMGRIQVLEEKVECLMNNKSNAETSAKKITTEDIRGYIAGLKVSARESGKSVLVLRSGDIHKDLGLKDTMPSVCNAMYQSMQDGDIILHTTPKKRSSTIEIEYKL